MSCPKCITESSFFGFSVDYRCTIKDEVISDSAHYGRYCTTNYYDECPIYRHSQSSGCFLTTIVCQILGKKDNDEILENFRLFRNNILQPNKKYHDTLKEYDVIGPMLVDCIVNDCDKEKIATSLYDNAMKKINSQIKEKKYDEAVESYYLMTLTLINYYGLKHEYNQIKDNDYGYTNFNPKTAGHGYKVKRKNIQLNQKLANNVSFN